MRKNVDHLNLTILHPTYPIKDYDSHEAPAVSNFLLSEILYKVWQQLVDRVLYTVFAPIMTMKNSVFTPLARHANGGISHF